MSQSSVIPPPTPGDFVPPSESGAGAIGADVMFARADHSHPRLTRAVAVVLDANGDGSVSFSPPYDAQPMMAFTRIPPISGGPCIFDVTSWITSGSTVTGANIKGWRLSGPQNLAAVTVVGISVAIGGQTITTYGPAAGVSVAAIALKAS